MTTPDEVAEALAFPALNLIRLQARDIARADHRFAHAAAVITEEARFTDATLAAALAPQPAIVAALKAAEALVLAVCNYVDCGQVYGDDVCTGAKRYCPYSSLCEAASEIALADPTVRDYMGGAE